MSHYQLHYSYFISFLAHTFETPNISNEKNSISIEIPSALVENLRFRLKYWVFQIRNFDLIGFSHLKYEIQSILIEEPSISKKVLNATFLVDSMYIL